MSLEAVIWCTDFLYRQRELLFECRDLQNLITSFACDRNDSTPLCCVTDGKVIHKNQTFKDEFMRREILALMVSRNFQDEGCTWRGEVRHLEVIFVDFLCEVNLNETICF